MIDGHNLIPKLGLRLESMDDEMELIAILQEFCRLGRKQAEVYFDGAPAPHSGARKLGTVTAHFVQLGTTADEAIRKRLKRMGKSARNWTVVSSDRQVQADARSVQAGIISSDAFAKQVKNAQASAPKSSEDRTLSPQELDEWLDLFRGGRKK